APLKLRSGLLKRIQREAEHARAGRPSGIFIKVNSMVDEEIIDALYRASQAGVPIDVCVGGICIIRAVVPVLSGTVRVRSVLGRYLEHSRIYGFLNPGGERDVWIGSADLMHRSLDRRIEVLVRLESPRHLARIDKLFGWAFSDDVSSWRLDAEDVWRRVTVSQEGEPLPEVQ